MYTRHTLSYLRVDDTPAPRPLAPVSFRGFSHLPPARNSNYLGYIMVRHV